ncbi:hypothetical protein D3C84_778950 [compost metagenome]
MVLAERMTCFDQHPVIFQAGQLLFFGVQQATAQVAFARAPVEPVSRRLGKIQVTGECLDLLPLAPRYIDIQTVTGRGQVNCG